MTELLPNPPPPTHSQTVNKHIATRCLSLCLSHPVFAKKRKDVSCFWQINSRTAGPLCSHGGEAAISWGYLKLYCAASIEGSWMPHLTSLQTQLLHHTSGWEKKNKGLEAVVVELERWCDGRRQEGGCIGCYLSIFQCVVGQVKISLKQNKAYFW